MKKEKAYRLIAVLAVMALIISLAPILYLTFFNYATGDDLNVAYRTHMALVEGESIGGIFRAIFEGVKTFYLGWSGNWSAAILWAVEPSVWGESVYHITGYVSLFFILGGSGFLLWYLNRKYLNDSRVFFTIIFSLYAFLVVQWIPAGHTAIFWFAVVANYIIPYGLMLMVVKWIMKYMETPKKRYLVYSALALVYIGGAGLMTMVVSFEILFLSICYAFFFKKNKTMGFSLMIVMLFFMVSAGANVLAPGNSVRSGGELSFAISDILTTVAGSIVRGIANIGHYFIYSRFLWVYIPLVVLSSWELIDHEKCLLKFRFPIGFVLITFLIYCSSYAPMTFMKDIEGSSGHLNIYWLLFTLWITVSIVYIIGNMKVRGIHIGDKLLFTARIGCVALVIMACILFRHFIGNMYGYKCYQYINSGELADYEAQMQERFEILANSGDGDVVLPQMNVDQGPFLHFAVTEDPENYTSSVIAHFYGKKSVIAIPREEFYEKYENSAGR